MEIISISIAIIGSMYLLTTKGFHFRITIKHEAEPQIIPIQDKKEEEELDVFSQGMKNFNREWGGLNDE